jgi:BioD-like phosphotransacetylase family protein
MDRIVVASMHKSAGKTSVILGLAKASNKRCGYMKPFGDRLLYSKKRLWDYDSALITQALGMEESPEDISIGFEHSKLRFMYDEAGLKEKLNEMVGHITKDRDLIFIEAGGDLMYGASVNLDAISLADYLGAGLLIVVSGDEGEVADDMAFLKEYVDMKGVNLLGVLVNKVKDIDDFKETYKETFDNLGVKVLGMVPHMTELTHITVDYLAKAIFAKVITGEKGLENKVKNVFVGAMSAETAIRNPLFKKDNKLIITPGDRHDMIIAALETDTAGIVLTCNVLPGPKVIAKASEKGIPLLLLPHDTFKVAKMIDDMEPLLAMADSKRIEVIERLIKENADLKAIFG